MQSLKHSARRSLLAFTLLVLFQSSTALAADD
ncbi:MAG: hypothetical protein ACI805_002776, partial [Candidatus Azotimanducaceae bacterium]